MIEKLNASQYISPDWCKGWNTAIDVFCEQYGWHSFNEKVPPEEDPILICDGETGIFFGISVGGKIRDSKNEIINFQPSISWWMRIPLINNDVKDEPKERRYYG